jgi:uncharacterized protein (TIGR02147 family)
LHLVIKGKRHLTEISIPKVLEVLSLRNDEEDYFKNLVFLNKSKKPSDVAHFAAQITKHNKYKKAQPVMIDQFDYYSHWYNIIIREIILSKPQVKWTSELLARAIVPNINIEQAESCLQRLERLNLIEKSEEGYQSRAASLSTGDQVSNSAVTIFHKKMIQLGIESIDRFAKKDRNVTSVSIGVSEEEFNEITDLLSEFRKKLLAISENKTDKSKIVQVNFQLFPIAKLKES